MAKATAEPVKRGPGRPRKDGSAPIPKNGATKKAAPPAKKATSVVKKGPGRPKKTEAPVAAAPTKTKGKKGADPSTLVERFILSEEISDFSNQLPRSVREAMVTIHQFLKGNVDTGNW